MSGENGRLHIRDGWRALLASAGLDSFEALLQTSAGRSFSTHRRGQVVRLELADGRAVFLKRDNFTSWKQILSDLFRCRRPEPLSIKEHLGVGRAGALGLRAPVSIAWGQRRSFGLPRRGVHLMTLLPGAPLDEYLCEQGDPAVRLAVFQALGVLVGVLHRAGLWWPDLRAKHLYVDTAGTVGLLDLERLAPAWFARARMRRQVKRFAGEVRELGADRAEIRAMFDGMEPPAFR